MFTTSSHEQTGGIIIFSQFEEVNLVENKHNAEEDESITNSIYQSYIYDDCNVRFISKNALEDIRDGSQIHPDINARDDSLKIRECIKQTQG